MFNVESIFMLEPKILNMSPLYIPDDAAPSEGFVVAG